MTRVANWVAEITSTIGTGSLVLLGSAGTGFTTFRESFSSGPVYYTIEDGGNRESGIGTFNGGTGLARTTVEATLVNGVYNNTSPAPIDILSAGAIVSCSMSAGAHNALQQSANLSPVWKEIPVQNWETGQTIPTFSLSNYVVNPDGSPLTFAFIVNNLPSSLNMDTAGDITGTIDAIQGGSFESTVTVTNSTGVPVATVLPAFLVGLAVTAPTWSTTSPVPDFIQEEGGSFSLDLNDYIEDDGNPTKVSIISFSYTHSVAATAGLTFGSNGIITGITTTAAALNTVTVRATNESLLSSDETFDITVNTIGGTSEIPVIDGWYSGNLSCSAAVVPTWFAGGDVFAMEVDVQTGVSIDLLGLYLASTGDSAVSAVSLAVGSALPDGLSLNASTGFITGDPTSTPINTASDTIVSFVATNAAGDSLDSPDFTFRYYTNVGVAPTITSIFAVAGTNSLYVNTDNTVTATSSFNFTVGFTLTVNGTPQALTYVSGDGTNQIEYSSQVTFSANNTLSLTVVNSFITGVDGGITLADTVKTYLIPDPSAGFIKTLDFENGVLGVNAVADGIGFSSGGSLSFYDNTHVKSGTKSCKMGTVAGTGNTGDWGGFISLPDRIYKGGELWYQVSIYLPTGFDQTANLTTGLKFLRVGLKNSDNSHRGYIDMYIKQEGSSEPFRFVSEVTDPAQQHRPVGTSSTQGPKRDVWETYEFYIKFDNIPRAEGGTGLIRFWKNGVLLAEHDELRTMGSSTNYADQALLFTYWNESTVPRPADEPPAQNGWSDNIILQTQTPGRRDNFGNPMIGI